MHKLLYWSRTALAFKGKAEYGNCRISQVWILCYQYKNKSCAWSENKLKLINQWKALHLIREKTTENIKSGWTNRIIKSIHTLWYWQGATGYVVDIHMNPIKFLLATKQLCIKLKPLLNNHVPIFLHLNPLLGKRIDLPCLWYPSQLVC